MYSGLVYLPLSTRELLYSSYTNTNSKIFLVTPLAMSVSHPCAYVCINESNLQLFSLSKHSKSHSF